MMTPIELQLSRGSAADVAAYTGAQGEAVVDTTNNRLVVQDGATAGGFPAAKLTDVNYIDVFLLAGQSNNKGDAPSTVTVTVPTGKVLRYGWDGTISDANDPLTSAIASTDNANVTCAWPSFGVSMFNATQRKILFVQTSVGGTSQVYMGNAATSWDTTGILFAQAITALNAAWTAAIAAGFTPIFRGVCWCQGEQDAIAINGATITQAQYMIVRFRAATIGGTTYPEMPFYLFRTGTDPAQSDVGFASIRAAQESVIGADIYSQIVFRDAIDFPTLGLQQAIPNSIHYTQAGYNIMGRVGARSILTGITDSLSGYLINNAAPNHNFLVGNGTNFVPTAPAAAAAALTGLRQTNSSATPPATSSTTAVMMGLGFSATPLLSGNFIVFASLSYGQSIALDGAAFSLEFGTGTPPTNGTAITGTNFGGAMPSVAPAAVAKAVSVTLLGLVSGLTPGAPYWFDLSYKALTGGTVTPVNVAFTFLEV
jgi:hypothetical protein